MCREALLSRPPRVLQTLRQETCQTLPSYIARILVTHEGRRTRCPLLPRRDVQHKEGSDQPRLWLVRKTCLLCCASVNSLILCSDPLPFQCLGESSQICENALFVDVDYPQLMEKKASVIAETPQLRDLLPGFRTFLHDGPIVVRSDTYLGIGCDLRDLTLLRKTLLEQLVSVNCLFLFLAEVSITYMKVEAADAVIAWASQFNQGT